MCATTKRCREGDEKARRIRLILGGMTGVRTGHRKVKGDSNGDGGSEGG